MKNSVITCTPEQKRLLFSQIITNFVQNRSELKPNWNLSGKYLFEWMPRLNKDYELKKTLQGKVKSNFDPKTNSLLPYSIQIQNPKLATNPTRLQFIIANLALTSIIERVAWLKSAWYT